MGKTLVLSAAFFAAMAASAETVVIEAESFADTRTENLIRLPQYHQGGRDDLPS
ncbi:MAG TPA: hypothetical protein PKI32_01950 [Opitutales bacterium]|nr:hypothetical protein [Opitutales bacterium]